MKKVYFDPEVTVRKYTLCADSVTTSDPTNNGKNDLNRDDQIDFFK